MDYPGFKKSQSLHGCFIDDNDFMPLDTFLKLDRTKIIDDHSKESYEKMKHDCLAKLLETKMKTNSRGKK